MGYRDNAIQVFQGKRMIEVWDCGCKVRVAIRSTVNRRRCHHAWKSTVNSRGGWRHGCLKCGALAR